MNDLPGYGVRQLDAAAARRTTGGWCVSHDFGLGLGPARGPRRPFAPAAPAFEGPVPGLSSLVDQERWSEAA
jgi:hypothetical protein